MPKFLRIVKEYLHKEHSRFEQTEATGYDWNFLVQKCDIWQKSTLLLDHHEIHRPLSTLGALIQSYTDYNTRDHHPDVRDDTQHMAVLRIVPTLEGSFDGKHDLQVSISDISHHHSHQNNHWPVAWWVNHTRALRWQHWSSVKSPEVSLRCVLSRLILNNPSGYSVVTPVLKTRRKRLQNSHNDCNNHDNLHRISCQDWSNAIETTGTASRQPRRVDLGIYHQVQPGWRKLFLCWLMQHIQWPHTLPIARLGKHKKSCFCSLVHIGAKEVERPS